MVKIYSSQVETNQPASHNVQNTSPELSIFQVRPVLSFPNLFLFPPFSKYYDHVEVTVPPFSQFYNFPNFTIFPI